jgi:glutamate dehydrogenase
MRPRSTRVWRGWCAAGCPRSRRRWPSGRAGARDAARAALRGAFPQGYRATNTRRGSGARHPAARHARNAGRSIGAAVPRCKRRGAAQALSLGGALALSDAVPVLENFGFRVIEEVPTALADDGRASSTISWSKRDRRRAGSTAIPERARGRDRRGARRRGRERRVQPADRRCRHGARHRSCCSAPGSAICARPACPIRWHRGRRAAPRARRWRAALIERFGARTIPARRARTAAIARRRQGDRRGSTRSRRSTTTASCGAARRGRGDAAHQRLRPGGEEALAFKLDSPRCRASRAGAVARDLGLQPARRGHPSARRPGRARRPALVRPARRFPHRDPRPDEGAARQERGDRADRRQGRLLSQAAARPVDRDAWLAEGTESYRIFIRTLLSITDNIVDGKVVHPDGVAIHDGEDPYFVVAADKGTATFSDVANAIALDRATSGWATPSRAAARTATTTRRWASPPRARGSRSSAISSKWASTCRPSRSASSAAATCRATCSATACCCRRR